MDTQTDKMNEWMDSALPPCLTQHLRIQTLQVLGTKWIETVLRVFIQNPVNCHLKMDFILTCFTILSLNLFSKQNLLLVSERTVHENAGKILIWIEYGLKRKS